MSASTVLMFKKIPEVQISGIDTKIEYLPIDTLLSKRIVKLHNIFYHVPLRTNIVIKVDIITKKHKLIIQILDFISFKDFSYLAPIAS